VKLLQEAVESAESHDLILYYTSVIDWASHKFYKLGNIKYMTVLATYYKKMEKAVSRAIKQIPESVFLILSDHGFDPKTQKHSSHGFWSINVKPPLIPRTILDFKPLILKLLRC